MFCFSKLGLHLLLNILFYFRKRYIITKYHEGQILSEAIINIEMRAAYRGRIVKCSIDPKKSQLLSEEGITTSNDIFWELMEKNTKGKAIDYDKVLRNWTQWFISSVEHG